MWTFETNVRVDDTGGLLDARALGPQAFVNEDGTMYVVWADGRAAPRTFDQDDIYLAKSSDGGLTFSSNVPVAVSVNRSGGVTDLVVANDGTIFVIWGEQVMTTGVSHGFFATSVDGGSSFSAPVVIDGHGWDESCLCGGQELARHGDTLYAAWGQRPADSRGGGLFLARSTNRGITWGLPARIDDAISIDPGGFTDISLAVDDTGRVYAVWSDPTIREVRLSRSLDAGLTFEPSVTVSPPGWIAGATATVERATPEVYVAWTNLKSDVGGYENRTGTVFVSRVADGGATILPPVRVTDLPANASHVFDPSVAVDGRGFISVSWTDDRDDAAGDVYFARSVDGGETFGGNMRVVDLPPGDGTAQVSPEVATNANGSVVIVWTDTRRDSWGGDIYSAVPTYLPDLSVVPSDLSWSPPSPREEETVVINATVHNFGWDFSPPGLVRFLNGTPPAPQIGADRTIPGLAVNATATVSVTWAAPPPGTYNVCVVVDPDDTVAETEEGNNLACRPITVAPPARPDLALTPSDVWLAPAPPVANGTAVLVTATVHNAGDADSPPTVVRFHDGTPPGPQVGADQPLPSLAPDGMADVSVVWTAMPPGAHDICVVVDPENATQESNEANNVACVPASVLPPETRPDYLAAYPLPTGTARAGLSLPVVLSLQVENAGNASGYATATISFFNASTPATPFATFAVPPLAPSEMSARFAASWVSPATPGTYAVLADVDSADDLVEWDETNNRYAWTIEVLAGPVTNLLVGAPNVTAAETYVTASTPLGFSVLDQSGIGIRNTTYRVGGGPWVNYTANGPFMLTGEGPHFVEWRSEDFAGNVEPVGNAALIVDDTPPTTTVSVGAPKYVAGIGYVTSLTPFTLAPVDGDVPAVGVNHTEYRIDTGPWVPYGDAFVVAGEGIHEVAFRSLDRLGNEEVMKVLSVAVDDTPPTIDFSLAGPIHAGTPMYVAGNTTVAADAIDPGTWASGVASLSCRIWSGPWTPYLAPFPLPAPDGPKAVECLAADHLGHAATVSFDVVLDATAPVVAVSLGTGTYPTGTLFSLDATDTGSGLASLVYRIDGGAWREYAGPFFLPEGEHTVEYRGTDNVTNAADGSFVATVSGPSTPPGESNWKPLVAAAFTTILSLLGAWSANRVPSRLGLRPRLRAFALAALPFVLLEAATGVVSFVTGWLSIPPILGLGTVVDAGILLAGVAVLVNRVRQRKPSE